MRQYSMMVVRGQRKPTRRSLTLLDTSLGRSRKGATLMAMKPARARFYLIKLPFLRYLSSPFAAEHIVAGAYAMHHMGPMGSRWS